VKLNSLLLCLLFGCCSHSKSNCSVVLSGGERSFATVCLLMALGQSLECPFSAADEFDVCLDAESRRTVIKSLIHVAKIMNRRQFIFITPLDLSGVQQDDDITIHMMKPPRGNGATNELIMRDDDDVDDDGVLPDTQGY